MLMPHWKKVLLCSCLFAAVAALGTGLARVAAKSATEAPAGFNTPSFNSAQSISNGIVEPHGNSFARDQQVYEKDKAVADGLGPVCNATSCVVCPQNPNSGSASQITELRVGHNDENGNFVNRQSSSTTEKIRSPAGPLSMIELSVRRHRSTYLRPKTFVHYALPPTPWAMDL